LFVNRRVNEGLAMPAAASKTAAAPAALLAGSFHSVAHKTHGRAAILDVAGKRVLHTDLHQRWMWTTSFALATTTQWKIPILRGRFFSQIPDERLMRAIDALSVGYLQHLPSALKGW
jgi:hypothetical protein